MGLVLVEELFYSILIYLQLVGHFGLSVIVFINEFRTVKKVSIHNYRRISIYK